MSDTSSSRIGCLRGGCTCCALFVGLSIALLVLVGVAQLAGSGEGESTEVERELEPPEVARASALALRPRETVESRALPLREQPGAEEALARGVGELRLDLSIGEFRIVPGPVGSKIRVEGAYEDTFVLQDELVERDDGTWTYSVAFAPKRGVLGLMMGAGNNPDNRLTIVVPRGLPLDLTGEIGIGESELELGGLLLREVDLETGTGEHTVRFSEPLQFAMDRLAIDGSIGSLRLVDVGNASPREVRVQHSIGECEVDLKGLWTQDSDIRLDTSIGEGRVFVPEDVVVDVDSAGFVLGERRVDVEEGAELPPGTPTLRIRSDSSIGEIRVTH